MRRAFFHFAEAYYAKNVPLSDGALDQVMFGDYPKDGGTNGEMSMCWYNVGGRTARLEVYQDAWKTLATFKDVIKALATYDPKGCTPEQFCALLKELGFDDATPRVCR